MESTNGISREGHRDHEFVPVTADQLNRLPTFHPHAAKAAIRVGIADSHHLMRAGLVALLRSFDDLLVVGEAETGAGAVALAETIQPDVLLLDIDLPDTGELDRYGAGIAAAIRLASHDTRVIVVTMEDSPEAIRKLLNVGVSGYLTKSVSGEELRASVLAAASGHDSVIVSLSRQAAVAFCEGRPRTPRTLTTREVDVLRQLAAGNSNRAMARELNLAEPTIKRHLTGAYSKLGVHTRLEAVAKARALGII